MTADDGGGGGGRGWPVRLAAGMAVAALAVIGGRLLVSGTSGSASAHEPPGLHRWTLVGCYDLRVGSWRVRWRDASAPDGVRGGEGGTPGSPGGERSRASGRTTSPSSSPPEASADGELPFSFVPPRRLMLLPDSVDRWGRALPSRRAEPLDGSDHPERSLRWMVRKDTLWLLWSEGDTRAGVALTRAADSLAGRVRTVRGRDSLDATAAASAHRVNCATLDRERPAGDRVRRR